MVSRWGFAEGDDEWDEEDDSAHREDWPDDDEVLHGRDSHGVVTMTVTDHAKVVSVHLDPAWRSSIEPRTLASAVLEAANAATMHALAKQVEQTDMSGVEVTQDEHGQASARSNEASQDDTPITTQDAMRLLDAVAADLGNYLNEVAGIANREFIVESGGGHVSLTSKQGQIAEVSIDSAWASQVRHTEIQSELLDAIQQQQSQSSLGDLAQGPKSPAISELLTLTADPQTLIRRIRPSSR